VRDLEQFDTLISTVAGGSPVVRALTLDYAKLHIRALGNADDELTGHRIDAAASYFEEQTGRQLLTATRELWLDGFPFFGSSGWRARIELPRPPLQSVVSIDYVDGDGNTQTYGGSPLIYRTVQPVGDYGRRGFVEPNSGQSWPIALCETAAVKIRYTCGYGDGPDNMPSLVRGILCFLIGNFDTFPTDISEIRGSVLELPLGVKAMMDGFKFSALPSQVLRTVRPLSGSTRYYWPGPWV
jgi:uncharacterized phiE125 gp8 family phage protein